MKRLNQILCTFFMIAGLSVTLNANAHHSFNAKLSGFEETPPILTDGWGFFESKLDRAGNTLSYTLFFNRLSSNATVAHIHFAQPGVAGGVVVFLCGGNSKPPCPAAGGKVTGTIIASDVISVPAQGVNQLSFKDFLKILKTGNGYVNVHTTLHPSGEIRGQIMHGSI